MKTALRSRLTLKPRTRRPRRKSWRQIATPQAPVNQQMREQLSPLDRIALAVTDRVGSFGFFALIQCAYFAWILLDLALPPTLRYDPIPAYPFLLFISNYTQLALMPLIMVGQNLQSRHAELRAEADFALTQQLMERQIASDQRQEALIALVQELITKVDALQEATRITTQGTT